MLKRILVFGAATVLALVLLALTIMAGSERGPNEATGLTPDLDADPLGDSTDASLRIGLNAYRATWVNDNGQLIQMWGEKLTPKPRGASEVEWPGARIWLTKSRVLQIRAEKGQFWLPGRRPQKGEFYGRVVITLYEAAGDNPPDLRDEPGRLSPDIALMMFMNEGAMFDVELDQIESKGSLHVTSPMFDFRGKGLNLKFSQIQKRIEELQVLQGDTLRLRHPPQTARATTKPATQAAVADAKPAETQPAEKVTDPVQYYRAQMQRQVVIRQADKFEIQADQADMVFALKPGGGTQDLLGPRSKRASAAAPPPSFLKMASTEGRPARATFAADSPKAARWPLPIDESMIPPEADDVIIKWTGPLMVLPEDPPPTDLPPGDALVELSGTESRRLLMMTFDEPRGVRGEPPRVKEEVKGQSLQYRTNSGLITLRGSASQPMVLASRTLGGEMRGDALVLDQKLGIGHIEGQGSLESREEGPADRLVPDGDRGRLPPGVKVTWSRRLDLSFTPASNAHDPLIKLDALKSAVFSGDVDIRHPQFAMKADTLEIGSDTSKQGETKLDRIRALGHVRVDGKDEEGQTLAVKSGVLDIDLEPDANGKVQPTRLRASENVRAELDQQTLTAGRLDVLLGPKAPEGTTRPAETQAAPVEAMGIGSDQIAVRTIIAQDNVVITTADVSNPMTLRADRLRADVVNNQVDISGEEGRLAVVERPDGMLAGERITVRRDPIRVEVNTPGRAEFVTVPAEPTTQPATQPGVAGKPEPQRKLTITWTRQMLFNDGEGIAQFFGDVVTTGVSERDGFKLTSDDLKIEFLHTPGNTPGSSESPQTDTQDGAGLEDLMGSSRTVRRITATEKVRFVASTYSDKFGGELMRQLTVDSPVMAFEQATQEVRIPQAGWLLMEDYRPAPATQPQDTNAPAADTGPIDVTKFSGRGQTRFTWTDGLTLNAERNDMLMQGNVQMLHMSPDKKTVQLDCRQLLADLEDTGGLNVWAKGKAQPSVKTIRADHDVRVIAEKKTVRTDHLIYSGATQTVTLKADPNRMVEFIDPDQPNAFRAEGLRWNLETGKVTIDQPGTGNVPIGR